MCTVQLQLWTLKTEPKTANDDDDVYYYIRWRLELGPVLVLVVVVGIVVKPTSRDW